MFIYEDRKLFLQKIMWPNAKMTVSVAKIVMVTEPSSRLYSFPVLFDVPRTGSCLRSRTNAMSPFWQSAVQLSTCQFVIGVHPSMMDRVVVMMCSHFHQHFLSLIV